MATSERVCGHCGHWSTGPEFGMDTRTGYCRQWEALKAFRDSCERFVDRDTLRREEARVFEAMVENGDVDD